MDQYCWPGPARCEILLRWDGYPHQYPGRQRSDPDTGYPKVNASHVDRYFGRTLNCKEDLEH